MTDIVFTKDPLVAQQVGLKQVDTFVSETVALTVSGGATPNNKADLDVTGYSVFVVEFDHNISGSSSTAIKLEVFASLLGAVIGTIPLATIALTTTGIGHAILQGSFSKLELKVTNSDASNTDNSVVRVVGQR